jgi:Uma2 family endonuclease
MIATLNLPNSTKLTREAFLELVAANPELQLERTSTGELVIMPPTGGETGDRNDEISFQLRAWNKQTKLGKTFNSSTDFSLPNGADRSPDASWVKLDRWEALTPEEKAAFPPLCPDFVVELRSPTDNLKTLQAKMQEYIEQGARLGWLIDPKTKRVEIYRPGRDKEVLNAPIILSGEDVLPGFVLDLQPVFDT